MSTNEGTVDRGIRVVAGLGILSLLFLVHGPAHWFGLIGLVPLLTGLSGYCPMYAMFGIRSCPLHHEP
jgi:hypothetical protein